MKLTKQDEKDLMRVYNSWWHSYLHGDVKTYDSYFADDYRFIGSTNNEDYLNRKDTTKFFEDTLDQLAGKAELRDLERTMNVIEKDLVLFTDLANAYVLSDSGWVFYSRFRFTSLIKKNKDGWRFTYQHFSAPDNKAQDGETLGTEQITKENQELRDAIKRRTVELEHSIRELAIEAALERVRSRSMAMHKSEELKEVIKVVYEQLVQLGFKIEHTGFIIDYKKNDDMHIWLTDQNEIPSKVVLPYFDCAHWNSFNNAKAKGINFFTNHLDFKEKNKFYKDLFKLIADVPKETLEYYRKCPGLAISTALLDNIGLYIENFEGIPYSTKENDTLMRFGKVFQQTYTRFLDLTKAEAQAREAQIELALERVRVKAMSMYKSEDISKTIKVVFKELESLGLTTIRCGIGIFDDQSTKVNIWSASSDDSDTVADLSGDEYLEGHQLLEGIYKHWQLQKDFSYTLKGNDLLNYYKKTSQSNFPVSAPENTNAIQYYHCVMFPAGGLFAFKDSVFSEDVKLLMKKFAEVFHLTFIRHQDLKKAEAQAREAKIETALEKVRTQAMGMQTSKDLSTVTNAMFEQLRLLGGELFATGIVFCDKHENHVEQWHSIPKAGMMSPFIVPINLDYIHQYRYDQWKKGTELFSIEIPSDFIEQHFNDIFKLPSAQVVLKEFEVNKTPMPPAPDWEIDYGASFNHGYLLVSALQPFEESEILPRFAKVFEQTYTRFLDLQKAEAQAREAQIEVSLERVRAKAMAMHHTDELTDVLCVLFDQFDFLGINPVLTHLTLMDEENETFQLRITSSAKNRIVADQFIDINAVEAWKNSFANWKNSEPNTVDCIDYEPSMLPEVWELLKEVMNALPEGHKIHPKDFPNGLYTTQGHFKFGYIGFNHSRRATEEEKSIVERFAREFGRTYQRFLDLQKAETQAREAQIENALEKVRSRTMAMQKSEELPEAANNLFLQLQELGLPAWSAGYCIWQDEKKNASCNMSTEGQIQKSFILPSIGEGYDFYTPSINGKSFHIHELGGRPLVKHYEFMVTLPVVGEILDGIIKSGFSLPTFQIFHIVYFKYGYVMFITYESMPHAHDIFKRFGKVFEQTYTRFLDLQKAEAQTRDAQINLAVERVRAKALAMHKSEEIIDVVAKLKDEVMSLDIPDVVAATIFLNEGGDKIRMWDLSSIEVNDNHSEIPFDLTFKIKKIDPYLYVKRVWENPEDYFVETQDAKGFKRLMQWLRELDKKEIADEVEDFIEKRQLKRLYHVVKKLNNGKLAIDLLNPPSDEMETILTKMGAAFDLAYKRFEDLQKAEAQTKEARIEAALERVRSRSMAMHKSEELLDVISVVSEQLTLLEFRFIHVSFANNELGQDYKFWTSSQAIPKPMRFNVPYLDIAVFNGLKAAQEKSLPFYTDILTLEEHKQWHQHLLKHGGSKIFSKEENDFIMSRGMARSIAINPNIMLILANYASIPYSEGENKIIERFGQVFEQSYTRFLDLKKAEAQARESQIETGLERVRAQTMAMHKSDQLAESAYVLYQQFSLLGNIPDRISIGIFLEETKEVVLWPTDQHGFRVEQGFAGPWEHSPIMTRIYNAWKMKKDSYVEDISGQNLKAWLKFIKNEIGLFVDESNIKERRVQQAAFFSHGMLLFTTNEPVSEEIIQLLIRFARVFSQTYTRFLDLQKAEAQVRESQIEAGLERVRSRTLAMQKSHELAETSVVVFQQLLELGISPNRLFIGIVKDKGESIEAWATNEDGSKLESQFILQASRNKFIKMMIEGWKQQEKSIVIDMKGKGLQDYFNYLNVEMHIPFKEGLQQKRRIQTIAYFSGGLIGMAAAEEQSQKTIQLLERFAAVFNLTYTRFNDLQIAEAQTREAKIETALERIRARALAMQEPEELKDVAQVLRTEMGLLGVEELETCSIYIHDKKSQKTECWYNLKGFHSEHNKLINDHFKLNLKETWVGKEMLKFYKSTSTEISIVMTGKNRKEWINYCEANSKPFQGYYGKEIPDRTYHLYKFSDGAIGAASAGNISEESWSLLKRAASVFSLAYSRFKDLTQSRLDLQYLKAEKKKAEDALTELQHTQKQLIQSEKMASLGELTAGIAHEIQNPLNFVNNFSEVSTELIDEMNEEIEKGDLEEVKFIMADIKLNLEKINHHGKRADAIVKGMLQHSRTSSAEKEPTDINKLADEYFRLAYHGLRAKDKTFNATLETAYDKTIGKVSVIPQDMGRVILNLITNAFYVVDEKKKSGISNYEPTVILSTKKQKNKITVSVKDNGNGIPKNALDKIFQPFFTTKPTGQGTGLGLSMSYDIVTKGHNGELKAETELGVGTEFIISLPI